MDSSESVLILPDILAEWPWKRNINPHHLQVKEESRAWIQSIFGSTPRIERGLDLGNFGLLVSLANPLENKDVLRASCDFTNMAFILDDTSETLMPHEVRQLGDIVMDAMRNPDKARPVGESVFGEAARQFWKSAFKCGSAGACRRFIQAFEKSLACVVQQVQDRAQNHIRNIDEYILLRRETSAVKPGLVFLEFELDLPDDIFEDHIIKRLTDACVDIISLSNDLYSYNIEQARGDVGHNVITIVMHHENVGVNEAARRVGDYISKLKRGVLDDLNHVPFFGELVQGQLNRYLDGLGNWIRGSDCWSFESRRYFGVDGLEIQQTKKVVLLPRSDPSKCSSICSFT